MIIILPLCAEFAAKVGKLVPDLSETLKVQLAIEQPSRGSCRDIVISGEQTQLETLKKIFKAGSYPNHERTVRNVNTLDCRKVVEVMVACEVFIERLEENNSYRLMANCRDDILAAVSQLSFMDRPRCPSLLGRRCGRAMGDAQYYQNEFLPTDPIDCDRGFTRSALGSKNDISPFLICSEDVSQNNIMNAAVEAEDWIVGGEGNALTSHSTDSGCAETILVDTWPTQSRDCQHISINTISENTDDHVRNTDGPNTNQRHDVTYLPDDVNKATRALLNVSFNEDDCIVLGDDENECGNSGKADDDCIVIDDDDDEECHLPVNDRHEADNSVIFITENTINAKDCERSISNKIYGDNNINVGGSLVGKTAGQAAYKAIGIIDREGSRSSSITGTKGRVIDTNADITIPSIFQKSSTSATLISRSKMIQPEKKNHGHLKYNVFGKSMVEVSRNSNIDISNDRKNEAVISSRYDRLKNASAFFTTDLVEPPLTITTKAKDCVAVFKDIDKEPSSGKHIKIRASLAMQLPYPPMTYRLQGRKPCPIVIDGCNLARAHGKRTNVFSCKGLDIAVNFFIALGHSDVKVFLPQYIRDKPEICTVPIVDRHILNALESNNALNYTPCREENNGRMTIPYDDRFMLQYAMMKKAVVISNDRFRDLAKEDARMSLIAANRTLMFTFVDDYLMVPMDPKGRYGPKLVQFLSDPQLILNKRKVTTPKSRLKLISRKTKQTPKRLSAFASRAKNKSRPFRR